MGLIFLRLALLFLPLVKGERRFWLGTMVDDHFLGTNVFEYSADDEFNLGAEVRSSVVCCLPFLDRWSRCARLFALLWKIMSCFHSHR